MVVGSSHAIILISSLFPSSHRPLNSISPSFSSFSVVLCSDGWTAIIISFIPSQLLPSLAHHYRRCRRLPSLIPIPPLIHVSFFFLGWTGPWNFSTRPIYINNNLLRIGCGAVLGTVSSLSASPSFTNGDLMFSSPAFSLSLRLSLSLSAVGFLGCRESDSPEP